MEIECAFCKNKFEFRGGSAHFARTKTHYCSRKCQNVLHGRSRRNEPDKVYDYYYGAKKRAKLKGVEFSIQLEDMPDIPKVCPILGILIKANITSAPLDSSPSLDRINPLLGYVRGNVRFISNRANRIKSDATLEELKLILLDAKRARK